MQADGAGLFGESVGKFLNQLFATAGLDVIVMQALKKASGGAKDGRRSDAGRVAAVTVAPARTAVRGAIPSFSGQNDGLFIVFFVGIDVCQEG